MNNNMKAHWKLLGINDTVSFMDYVRSLFEKHDHQQQVICDMYKLIFPDWDRIKHIKNYPATDTKLWEFVWDLFLEFDKKYHPDCMPGGAWLNIGFSVNRELQPYEIDVSECEIEYL